MPIVSSQPEVKYRIGMVSGFFIVAAAAFFDGIGFLLMLTGVGEIMTEIIGFDASILFFVWFLFLRVSYFSGRAAAKLGIMGAGTLIETIPFINGFAPMFIIETASIIHISRKEDREKASKENAERVRAAAKLQQQREQREALYRQLQQQAANDNEQALLASNDNEGEGEVANVA